MTDELKNASAPFDAVTEAKRLLRSARAAALATLVRPTGDPFSSLVNIATATDGSPILLLSRLAAHTRHIDADPRVSLLLYSALNQPNEGDPLTHARLTLLGHAERVHDADHRQALRRRFLARHPKSSLYADFTDFGFFLVTLTEAHLNGGFGRAANLSASSVLTSLEGADTLVAEEAGRLAEIMDTEPQIGDMLAAVHGGGGPGPWRLLGFDPEGLDLGDGESLLRVAFVQRVTTAAELRREIAMLLQKAKARDA